MELAEKEVWLTNGSVNGRAVAPRPPLGNFDVAKCTRNGGRRGAPTLPKLVANFKHLLAARYGLRFQRDFWDTRLRDEAHYAEKFRYICNNPVRKGLCASAREWRPVIAFDRESGVERSHR